MAIGDLTDLATVKQWLDLPVSTATPVGTAFDGLLTDLISSVSSWIQDYCSCSFADQAYTMLADGNGKRKMWLPEGPVTSVTSVLVDGTSIPYRSTWNGSGWTVAHQLLSLDGYTFNRGNNNVFVTYTAGYATVPAEIKFAATQVVTLRFKERKRYGHVSENLAGQVVTYLTDVAAMPDVMRILDQNRKVVPQ